MFGKTIKHNLIHLAILVSFLHFNDKGKIHKIRTPMEGKVKRNEA